MLVKNPITSKTHRCIVLLNSNNFNIFSILEVIEASTQVVSGRLVKISVRMQLESKEVLCAFDIWEQAWKVDGRNVKVQCDNEKLFEFNQKPMGQRESKHDNPSRVRVSDDEQSIESREKRSIRPMPGRHDKFHSSESSEHKAGEMKSAVLFENFVKKYHRRYSNDQEHKMRHRIFKKNLHKIDMLNKHEQGTAKYGISPFSDLTEKEYLHKTGLLMRQSNENEIKNPIAEIPDISEDDLPTEFDWTEKNAVTSVKNQGNCGSCWSFAVTGNIEGLHAIKTGKIEAYSEQELLDCDTTDNGDLTMNHFLMKTFNVFYFQSACNGGFMDDAFKAIEKIGGLELEDEYPYKAKKQKKCLFNASSVKVKVKGVVDMPKGDEVAMMKYLVANGPISIGINAAAMQFYRGGKLYVRSPAMFE